MLMGLKSMGTADEAAAALATGKRDKSEQITSYSEPMSPVFSAIIRTSQLNPKRGHNK
jgi:hypothetical protein